MTVPTNNLYDFVHQTTKRQYWLMYFYPWGSKDLTNLIPYQTDKEVMNSVHGIPPERRFSIDGYDPEKYSWSTVKKIQPCLICHDQEPLTFERHTATAESYKKILHSKVPKNLQHLVSNTFPQFKINNINYNNVCILLHSELNSPEVEKYQKSGEFSTAYWWSHAAIARDWYRYAQFDTALDHYSPDKLFLIYCRDAAGTRQYRKDFLELVQSHELTGHAQVGSRGKYNVTSESSAEYHSLDLVHTGISVVLETVFDSRIHLTEKTLRPIACGHPFMLAAGSGSLSYIRSYGFKTFSPFINESYDSIADPTERLNAIATEMKRISQLTTKQQSELLSNCKEIAMHNKCHFFSDAFFTQIKNELEKNVNGAHSNSSNTLDLEKWNQVYTAWQSVSSDELPQQHHAIFADLLRQRKVNL